MKQNLHKGLLLLLYCSFFFIGCKKSSNPSIANPAPGTPHDTTLTAAQNPLVPYPLVPSPECNNAPDYGDSIVYPQPGTADFNVYPVNNQGQQGTYLSWPGGLVMDSKTGIIDLTQSETGARYSVAFVKYGTSDTCISQLIVAGAAYMDSVYVLSKSDTTSAPYFNANPFGAQPCSNNNGNGCHFDYNDFAKRQGIEVNKKTGYIDLKKTMKKGGPFGPFPFNGETVYTTIYYQLDDNSNSAPQNIQLQLIYYNHLTDIPAGTLATISDRLANTWNDIILGKGAKPRPPMIIIVRQN